MSNEDKASQKEEELSLSEASKQVRNDNWEVGDTKYRPEYAEIARVLCKELHATKAKLGKVFGVTGRSITNWKNKHPKFGLAVQQGYDAFRNEPIERSLYKRATGYEVDEVVRVFDKDKKLVSRTVRTKHIPADVNAATFILKNRDPERWKDSMEINGTIAHKGVILMAPVATDGKEWENRYKNVTPKPRQIEKQG